jgi:signal-transduction protein with cAMP-binding, CBS, and nucleotidyltransferase domain
MAVFLGARGEEILTSRGAVELVNRIREQLMEKMSFHVPEDEYELLQELKARFGEELAFEARIEAEFAGLVKELAAAEYADMVPPLQQRFSSLMATYFQRRESVLEYFAMCDCWRDGLLKKAFDLSSNGLASADQGELQAPCCLLVTGSAGRQEQGLQSRVEYFLLNGGESNSAVAMFDQFAYRFIALLEKFALLGGGSRVEMMQKIWHGSISAWQSWLDTELQREQDHQGSLLPAIPALGSSSRKADCNSPIFMLADLRPVQGEPSLSLRLQEMARTMLAREQETERFFNLSRKVTSFPLALGFFGGFRVKRSGPQRGKLDLDELAIIPLVTNIAILVCKYGLAETGTIPRIKTLVARGYLGVDLGERLLRAYQDFNRHRILLDLARESRGEESLLNPENLTDDEVFIFKGSVEAVSTLQQIVYQLFSDQG